MNLILWLSCTTQFLKMINGIWGDVRIIWLLICLAYLFVLCYAMLDSYAYLIDSNIQTDDDNNNNNEKEEEEEECSSCMWTHIEWHLKFDF